MILLFMLRISKLVAQSVKLTALGLIHAEHHMRVRAQQVPPPHKVSVYSLVLSNSSQRMPMAHGDEQNMVKRLTIFSD